MPAKKRKSFTLIKLIGEDGRRKKLLRKEFPKFYMQLEKVIEAHPEIKALQELKVPLEKMDKMIEGVAHGVEFGTLNVGQED